MAESEERVLPSNAEDAAHLKAMEAMESTADDAAVNNESAEALGKAMQDLGATKTEAAKTAPAASTKVNAADVALIVEEMEVRFYKINPSWFEDSPHHSLEQVSKSKATDTIRACGGNVVEALRTLVYTS